MSEIPCNGCTACCRNGQLIILMDDDDQSLGEPIGDPAGTKALPQKPNGDCAYLGPEGCTIYDRRPLICRAFDCRMQFLSLPRGMRRKMFGPTRKNEIFRAAQRRLGTLDDVEREHALQMRSRHPIEAQS